MFGLWGFLPRLFELLRIAALRAAFCRLRMSASVLLVRASVSFAFARAASVAAGVGVPPEARAGLLVRVLPPRRISPAFAVNPLMAKVKPMKTGTPHLSGELKMEAVRK
jgi:hypothetical protein